MKEVWKDVVGFEGLYQVSNLGNVKSILLRTAYEPIKRDKILKQNIQTNTFNKSQRANVYLRDKDMIGHHVKVHRLVAQAFIPNPKGCVMVCHLDGNTLNNCVDNLEWRMDGFTVDKETIEKICEEYKTGVCKEYKKSTSISKLAKKYGLSKDKVERILKKNGLSRRKALAEKAKEEITND